MFCSQQFSRALEQQVTYCKGLVIIRCITNKPNERWAERAHSGLIFSGYCLGLVQALALGTCFSPRTPCCLIASGHAVCSSAALRSSPQLASLLQLWLLVKTKAWEGLAPGCPATSAVTLPTKAQRLETPRSGHSGSWREKELTAGGGKPRFVLLETTLPMAGCQSPGFG